MKIDWLKGDGAIILSAEETDAFEIIMSSQEHDLVKLVRSAGHDPLTFFEDGNWREVDFRDSDLRGVSFARANMTGVILYEDQFDEVRKTRPRTLDKAKIQRSRDGGKGDDFYFILDTPLDPSIARTEFKAELEKLFGGTRKPFLQADDWRSLVRYLPQLDQPFGHIWALECILDLTKRMPSDDVLDACARGFDLTVALRGAPWSLAVELLHVCSLKDDRSRFAFLESRVAEKKSIDARLTALVVRRSTDEELYSKVLDIYHSNDWILDPLITIPGEFKMRKLKKESSLRKLLHSDDLETQLAANTAAQNYLQRIFPGNRPSLDDLYCDLEAAFEIDNPMIFRSYAKRAGSMNHVAMFIETMNEFGVNPDIDVFVGLTNGVETLADAQQFLTLMHDCGIDPTSDVFAGLSRGAKTSMEAHKILELMTKSGIQPDQRHYRAFLSACATVEEAGDFLRLLSDLGQRPLRRDLLTLLHNAPDQHEAERIRDLMRSFGFCSNHVAWLVLIDTLPTWALIWDAYTSRSPRSKCMRKHVVGRLLENCQDGTELITTLEEIHRYKLADLRLGYKLTDIRHAIDRVLRSALSDSEIIRILRRLGSLGLEIDSIKPYYYVGFPGSERFALLREQARSSD